VGDARSKRRPFCYPVAKLYAIEQRKRVREFLHAQEIKHTKEGLEDEIFWKQGNLGNGRVLGVSHVQSPAQRYY
jgi:hypothetical protein